MRWLIAMTLLLWTGVASATPGPMGWSEYVARTGQLSSGTEAVPRSVIPQLRAVMQQVLRDISRQANQPLTVGVWIGPDRATWQPQDIDCTGFVVRARAALQRLGIPINAMPLSVVYLPRDGGHVVLVVRHTDGTQSILDLMYTDVYDSRQRPIGTWWLENGGRWERWE